MILKNAFLKCFPVWVCKCSKDILTYKGLMNFFLLFFQKEKGDLSTTFPKLFIITTN